MRKSDTKLKYIIGAVLMVLILVGANFFQNDIRSFFYKISLPIQKTLWVAGNETSDFFASIAYSGDLKKQRDETNCRNQELLVEVANLEELKKQNEELRCALNIKLSDEFNLDMAQIAGKDISQDFILIDKGAKDGLNKGMAVITSQKVLVGKISEVYDVFSKVMLITNKDSSFDAQIRERGISGIIKGKGGLKLFFDLIPQDKEVSSGDIIVSSSLAGLFPDGLLVGKITDVKRNDIESFQQAGVEPSFDINSLSYLFIIIGK
jgi:rod shape-determining protein MreC